jgi:hypothetical protein
LASPNEDRKAVLPIVEQEDSPKAPHRHWHALPWVIAWAIKLVWCCAVIGRYHKLLLPRSIAKEQEHKMNKKGEYFRTHLTYSHSHDSSANIFLTGYPLSGCSLSAYPLLKENVV